MDVMELIMMDVVVLAVTGSGLFWILMRQLDRDTAILASELAELEGDSKEVVGQTKKGSMV